MSSELKVGQRISVGICRFLLKISLALAFGFLPLISGFGRAHHMGSNSKLVVDFIEGSFSGFHLDGLEPRNLEVEQPTTSAAEHVHKQPFVIEVAGGAVSGKTTVCDMIIEQLHDQRVVLVNQPMQDGRMEKEPHQEPE